MNKLNNLALTLIITILFAGCKKNENDNYLSEIEYIKYGTSFGECFGYCNSDIKITNTKIEYQNSGWTEDQQYPKISKIENINTKYTKQLISKINLNSFYKLNPIIGCPDCADGGSEWIEIKSKGKTHKVTFEYQNEPKETKDYIGYLRTYINTFKNNTDTPVNFNDRTIIDQKGFVKKLTTTKENNMWLIGIINKTDTSYYFDKHLYTEFKSDKLKIEFNAVLNYDSTTISTTDIQQNQITNIKIRNIKTFNVKTNNN